MVGGIKPKKPVVVVTRPKKQSKSLMDRLHAYGFSTLPFPTIEIVPWLDQRELKEACLHIKDYRWLVFTSVNGVAFFFQILQSWKFPIERLAHLKIAAIGDMTAKAVEDFGLSVSVCPSTFIAESLAQAMIENDQHAFVQGAKVLLPRAAQARRVLVDQLEQTGAHVDVVPVYRTIASSQPVLPLVNQLTFGQVQCISFTSSSTVSCFFERLEGRKLESHLRKVAFAAIGPITAKTLREFGFHAAIVAPKHTTESLALAILEYFRKDKGWSSNLGAHAV